MYSNVKKNARSSNVIEIKEKFKEVCAGLIVCLQSCLQTNKQNLLGGGKK